MTARSRASQNFLALGKHNWRVHGDAKCVGGESEYDIEMKLTGCGDDEFTCGSGDCLEMKKRCNHIPNCQDESDEMGCKNMVHGKIQEMDAAYYPKKRCYNACPS